VPTVRHTARCHACRRVARGPVRSCVHEKYICGAREVYAGSMTGIRPEAGDRCLGGSVKCTCRISGRHRHLRRAGGCLAAMGSGLGFWPGSRANWRPLAGTPVAYETVSCSARPGARARSPQGIPPRSKRAVAGTSSARMRGWTAAASYAAAPDARAVMSKSSAARRSPPWQGLPERLADAPPGGGDGVAGVRPSVRASGSGARGDEHRDRGSNLTAPPH
jgi:hypothetical protein